MGQTMGGGLGGTTGGGLGGSTGASGGGLGSSGGGGLSSSGFSSGGGGSQFLGTGVSSSGGSQFLSSGYSPGSLGQAALAGSKNPTNTGDLFSRFFVNPLAVGFAPAGSTSSTMPQFGIPLYASLYPGTQITSPFSTTATASITSRSASVIPGFTGSGGFGTGIGVSTRPAAAYTTVIGFKHRSTPPRELLANLGDVLARSADLADTRIQLILDGSTVVMRGNVSDWEQRRLAENLLKLTPGVNGVKNELVVLEAPTTPKAGQ
jgi:hypothetical protein